MPRGIALTKEDQETRRKEIFNAAVGLFLEKGFQETSMRAIAEAAGMGKSSLYDYFKTKDEILVFILEEETLIITRQAQEIAGQNIPPEERLRQIMKVHLGFLQANHNLLFRLNMESQRLNPASLRGIQEKRYAYQNMIADLIQEGISRGQFREVNPLNAARLLLNTFLSILYTSRPTGSAEEMLDEALEIYLHGLEIDWR